jgi:very-short-patch-repair endonuclease
VRGKSIGNVLGFIGFVLDGFHFDFFAIIPIYMDNKGNNLNKELIADFLANEKSYDLESICDKYKLKKSEGELDPWDSKKKYVLSRISSENNVFLLNLAIQLLEDYESTQFARGIEKYFPEGIFKLSSTTRNRLIDDIASDNINCDIRSIIKNSWDFDTTNPMDIFNPIDINTIPIKDLLIKFVDFLYVSDKSIINFLELLTHPRVCDEKVQNLLVKKINNAISIDGFKLKEEGYYSDRVFYKIYDIKGKSRGSIKNLIFSAVGYKPEIVLSDSLNNDIKIVKNENSCLVYEKPIPKKGLTWKMLILWWQDSKYFNPQKHSEKELYTRLFMSLDSPPEKLFFKTYFKYFRGKYKNLPALIPQVYLHYDPYTLKQLKGKKRLHHQRMDFLLLLPAKNRVVIEIDGKQHYSEGNISSPKLYSEMVKEDRELKFRGYEIFRLGGYELSQENSEILIKDFISKLFEKYGIEPI